MLFKAAVLSTLLSVGAEAGTSQNENNLVQAIRSGASNSISQTGQQIVQRQLNIQPTLTIRPGFPVRVIVTRDLVLAPYAQGGNAMTKLKLGPLADDKPVKLTHRIAGGGASRSCRLCRGARPDDRAGGHRPGEADRADDRAIHGDRSSFREGATRSSRSGLRGTPERSG